jgi:hypothetical protein
MSSGMCLICAVWPIVVEAIGEWEDWCRSLEMVGSAFIPAFPLSDNAKMFIARN